jgi:hypothetical protein
VSLALLVLVRHDTTVPLVLHGQLGTSANLKRRDIQSPNLRDEIFWKEGGKGKRDVRISSFKFGRIQSASMGIPTRARSCCLDFE